MAFINFNAADVDPNQSFEPIPAGKYLAAIVDSTTKPTKNGAGEYLEIVLEVLEGPYKGRRLWERLTLKHPNDVVVRIASANLSAICHAVAVMTLRDSHELHDIPMTVTVALRPVVTPDLTGPDASGADVATHLGQTGRVDAALWAHRRAAAPRPPEGLDG